MLNVKQKDKKQLKIIRINPAKENFNIFDEICKIHHYIIESKEKLNKESLRDKTSIRLLKLEFKSNNSIKTKCLKWIVKNILPKIKCLIVLLLLIVLFLLLIVVFLLLIVVF